jgi:hypothetical protein
MGGTPFESFISSPVEGSLLLYFLLYTWRGVCRCYPFPEQRCVFTVMSVLSCFGGLHSVHSV